MRKLKSVNLRNYFILNAIWLFGDRINVINHHLSIKYSNSIYLKNVGSFNDCVILRTKLFVNKIHTLIKESLIERDVSSDGLAVDINSVFTCSIICCAESIFLLAFPIFFSIPKYLRNNWSIIYLQYSVSFVENWYWRRHFHKRVYFVSLIMSVARTDQNWNSRMVGTLLSQYHHTYWQF